ncbi:hypothetical protein RFI_05244 [Reticulomyxa filosa]|uniref:Sulfotransferase domain-containing protein n=1 Tax=Reticulomyxa filosa TaxID=46433 RepID=X6P2U7_RETFI|nr:hypothetical protein RFI_05244 [Reticulomyxa filosa]|eukprot:ETO31872.1 hypothetical protein RFI_05244 [Reticulomyxa filosa]
MTLSVLNLPKWKDDSQILQKYLENNNTQWIFPKYMIIGLGCKKCGTSTLRVFIDKVVHHLKVEKRSYVFKELHYWDRMCPFVINLTTEEVEDCSMLKYVTTQQRTIEEDRVRSSDQFLLYFEKSPSYMVFPSVATALTRYSNFLQQHIPASTFQLKFLVILRNPVSRLWSDYFHTFASKYKTQGSTSPKIIFEHEILEHILRLETIMERSNSNKMFSSLPRDDIVVWKMKCLFNLVSKWNVNAKNHWKQRLEHDIVNSWIDTFDTMANVTVDFLAHPLLIFFRGCYFPQMLMYLNIMTGNTIIKKKFKVLQFETFVKNYNTYFQEIATWIGALRSTATFDFNAQLSPIGHASGDVMSDDVKLSLQNYYKSCNDGLYPFLNQFKPFIFFKNDTFYPWY